MKPSWLSVTKQRHCGTMCYVSESYYRERAEHSSNASILMKVHIDQTKKQLQRRKPRQVCYHSHWNQRCEVLEQAIKKGGQLIPSKPTEGVGSNIVRHTPQIIDHGFLLQNDTCYIAWSYFCHALCSSGLLHAWRRGPMALAWLKHVNEWFLHIYK